MPTITGVRIHPHWNKEHSMKLLRNVYFRSAAVALAVAALVIKLKPKKSAPCTGFCVSCGQPLPKSERYLCQECKTV